MNDIPGLRLAPTRMIALAELRGRSPLSAAPRPSPGAHQTAVSPNPRVVAGTRPDATERPLGGGGAEPAAKRQAASAASSRGAAYAERLAERQKDNAAVPEQEFSFLDLLDVINPLQHIPIFGAIYRAVTGDEMSAPARILGGILFGGPIGFMAALANTIIETVTGRDLGETVMAAIFDDEAAPDVLIADSAGEATAPPKGAEAAAIWNGSAAQPGDLAAGPVAAGADPVDLRRAQWALAGPAALDAYARDIKGIGRPARNAPASGATLEAVRVESPHMANGMAIADRPGAPEPRARPAAPTASPQRPSPSRPGAVPPPDNPVAAAATQAPGAVPGDPRLLEAASPAPAFAERMLHALEKYQAMAREGATNERPRTPRLDTRI